MALHNNTLFAAIVIAMVIMAVAFLVAGRDGRQPYWTTWAAANALIASALIFYIIGTRLPQWVFMTVPNTMLVAGFGLRWRAAREFGNRSAAPFLVWGPAGVLLAVCVALPPSTSYAPVYSATNLLLTALAIAAAREFWRDRADGLPSRPLLTAAYVLIACSFAVRAAQGLFSGETLGSYLPLDGLLTVHLLVGLVHTCASGAFALSISYEKNAAELRHLATVDALTGVFNRGAFEKRARTCLAADRPCAIVLLDIDHFKRINDRYGHAAGDEALRRCAALCSEVAGPGNPVGRIGGEEFAVLIEDAEPEAAALLAERLRLAVDASMFQCGARTLRLTISLGFACRAAGGPGYEEIMREADAALYRAKDGGRNRVERIVA